MFAERVIHLFDGKILREEEVAEPIQALEEMTEGQAQ